MGIDLDKLNEAIKEYQEARQHYLEAKEDYKLEMQQLETAKVSAKKTLAEAYKIYQKAGEAFTKFTDEHPDPDEENEQGEE